MTLNITPKQPKNYIDWLLLQTHKRQIASLRHMRVCSLLGIARRRYPHSLRTKNLSRAVAAYYAEHLTDAGRQALHEWGA